MLQKATRHETSWQVNLQVLIYMFYFGQEDGSGNCCFKRLGRFQFESLIAGQLVVDQADCKTQIPLRIPAVFSDQLAFIVHQLHRQVSQLKFPNQEFSSMTKQDSTLLKPWSSFLNQRLYLLHRKADILNCALAYIMFILSAFVKYLRVL